MKNRYGNEYHFEAVDANTFTIKGELSNWRFGGREGQSGMDFNDLGFVDPSGGPFIELGMKIGGRKITNIRSAGEDIFFQVESA
jgi:hypothetical protein